MNKYETIILLDCKLDEKKRNAVISKIEKFIRKQGTLESVEDKGIKVLAYEVRGNKEAHYYQLNFETEPYNIRELERLYRITDEILKFIVVRVED